MMWLFTPAMAWQSECFVGPQDADYPGHPLTCEEGLQRARHRWELDEIGFYSDIRKPEHATIWTVAAGKSGVNLEVFEEHELKTFIDPEEIEGWTNFTSIQPRMGHDEVKEGYTRTIRAAEMTQLPDMSFTLWDWAMGNEVCPLEGVTNLQSCHEFTKHLGGLNSSHFAPQAQTFYWWYHDMALTRAEECAAADAQLNGLYEDRPDLKEYVMACEKNAMVLEAVGQHYLQDAWSSGHTWERWGSPEWTDWLAMADGDPATALTIAMSVGMFSGSWHGVRIVMEDPKSPVQSGWTGAITWDHWEDPMCSPAPSGTAVNYVSNDGLQHEMVGDLYFDITSAAPYQNQHFEMLSCSVSGIRQVYEATAQVHGAIEGIGPGVEFRDPTDATECFDQRATNASLALGAAIHVGEAPDQNPMHVLGVNVPLQVAIWGSVKSKYGDDPELAETDFLSDLGKQFRAEAAALVLHVQTAGVIKPNGTESAEGLQLLAQEKRSLLGAMPNSHYVNQDQPSTWIDQQPPWKMDDEKTQALNLVFAEATAWERCDEMTEDQLEDLRHPGWPELPSEQDFVIRDHCEQLAAPFLRVGTDDSHYAKDKQPLCHFAGSPAFVYSGHADLETTREVALESWCATELLEDGGFEQRSGWDMDYNADVLSGINTFVPYAGSQMLDVYLTPDASAAFGRVWQHLDQDLSSGSWELRFMWRVWTSWQCTDWGDPWAVARVDQSAIGQDEVAVFDLANTLWCDETVVHSGGRYKSDWVEAVLPFEGPVTEPVISFIGGTGSGTYDHHLLIDNVTLKKVD